MLINRRVQLSRWMCPIFLTKHYALVFCTKCYSIVMCQIFSWILIYILCTVIWRMRASRTEKERKGAVRETCEWILINVLPHRCCTAYRTIVDETSALSSICHITVFLVDPFKLFFYLCLSIHRLISIHYPIFFHRYLLSTLSFRSATMCDVVKVCAVPDEDILIISEYELNAIRIFNVWDRYLRWDGTASEYLSEIFWGHLFEAGPNSWSNVCAARHTGEAFEGFSWVDMHAGYHYRLGLISVLLNARLNSYR